MSYQPDEAAVMRALKVRSKNRDNQYVSLMELSRRGLEGSADQFGVVHEGISSHDVACRVVDVMYPEANAGPATKFNTSNDTMLAQEATAADRQRYAYMTGDLNDEAEPIGSWVEPGGAWPVDVPERMAGVGYKRGDGTICPLDSEGSVLLSGWGPEKVRFLLVSLAPFFDADYVKEFVLALTVAAHQGQYNLINELVRDFVRTQNWTEDAEEAILSEAPVAAKPSDEPIYDQAAQQTGGWLTDNQAKEYPTVGTGDSGDAPTEVISTGEINQYKPGPY
jgi:hypothetical protein